MSSSFHLVTYQNPQYPSKFQSQLFAYIQIQTALRSGRTPGNDRHQHAQRDKNSPNWKSIRDKVLSVTDLKHLAELYKQHG